MRESPGRVSISSLSHVTSTVSPRIGWEDNGKKKDAGAKIMVILGVVELGKLREPVEDHGHAPGEPGSPSDSIQLSWTS